MTTVDHRAKLLYDACPTVKPTWDQLGDVTKSVWRERVEVKTIIAGSRSITSYQVVEAAVWASGFNIVEVVSGRAREGVDALGEQWAAFWNIPVKPFPAQWRDKDGELHMGAGMIRNGAMAAYADALIAVWDGSSPGTEDMINRARKAGLLVHVHNTLLEMRNSLVSSGDTKQK